jgi:glycosyltransferase involved in cell wall biosynthesis
MLMRTDVGSKYESFEKALDRMKHPERVRIIREKVDRTQLRAFFGSAWYALLPFIVIPSEIPLTYFELLSCGTPVITFRNGGTTEYLKEGLLIADKSVKGLVQALDRAWSDEPLRRKLSENGKLIMVNHPTWSQVGSEWIKLLKK